KHGVEIGNRGFSARDPGELVVAQARDPDGIDLDGAEAPRHCRHLGGGAERAPESEAVEQEAAQLRRARLAHPHSDLLLTPASSKLAMPLWQAIAERSSGIASAAPEASPSRMPRSSSGFLPRRSKRRRWPGSAEQWATRQ